MSEDLKHQMEKELEKALSLRDIKHQDCKSLQDLFIRLDEELRQLNRRVDNLKTGYYELFPEERGKKFWK